MVFEEESAKNLQYYFVSYFPPEVVMDIYPCRSRTPAAHLLTFVLCAQLEGDWKTCLFSVRIRLTTWHHIVKATSEY